jgi:hypothetical protein
MAGTLPRRGDNMARTWQDDFTSLTVHDQAGHALPLKVGVVDTGHSLELAVRLDDLVEFDVHPQDINRLISGLLRHRDSIGQGL